MRVTTTPITPGSALVAVGADLQYAKRGLRPGEAMTPWSSGGKSLRPLMIVAGAAWLMVAASGVWSAVQDGHGDDDWVVSYTVFMLSLIVAAIVSVSVVAKLTHGARRPRMRKVGLVVAGLGCFMSIAAWALPVWMVLLGSGYALIALSVGPPMPRAIACLSAAQLVGTPALIVATEIGVGTPDSYGDYPAAAAIALVMTVSITILGLALLSRSLDDPHRERGSVAPLPAAL